MSALAVGNLWVRIDRIVPDAQRCLLGSECGHGIADVSMEDDVCLSLPTYAVRSGPRRQIYFDPKTVSAAVVTCGGLCPGLNDVVQAIVTTLNDYGVPEDNVLGTFLAVLSFPAASAGQEFVTD